MRKVCTTIHFNNLFQKVAPRNPERTPILKHVKFSAYRLNRTSKMVKTRRNHWAGDTSLVGASVGLNPTRNQIFLITFNWA